MSVPDTSPDLRASNILVFPLDRVTPASEVKPGRDCTIVTIGFPRRCAECGSPLRPSEDIICVGCEYEDYES